MSDTTRLNLDALDECYHRGGQPTMDEGKALVARVRELEAEVERLRSQLAEVLDVGFGYDDSDESIAEVLDYLPIWRGLERGMESRAEAAEATIQRVRDLRDRWRTAQSLLTGSPDRVLIAFAEEIDRALDGGPDTEEADRD